MQSWLRSLQQSRKGRKSTRNGHQKRPAWRAKLDGLEFHVERLEERRYLAADVGISQLSGPGLIATVGTQTFTYLITNNDSAGTAGLTFTDSFVAPAGTTPVTVSDSAGLFTANNTYASGTAIPFTTQLGASGTATGSDTVTISFKTTQPGALVNTASVSETSVESNPLNNTAGPSVSAVEGSVALGVFPPDLSIAKSASSPTISAGGVETYTLTVINPAAAVGPGANATSVTVTDLLPAGATGATISGTGATPGTFTNGAITATIATLTAGQTVSLTVTATLNAPGLAINTANVEGLPGDANQLDNFATATALVTGTATAAGTTPDLGIVKTQSSPTVTTGGTETYALKVTNTGSVTATSVTVTDILPTGASGTITGPSGWSFNNSGGGSPAGVAGPILPSTLSNFVTASIPTLTGGATATLTVTATLAFPGKAVNLANVEGLPGDTSQTNNISSVTATVQSPVDISITKTGSAATISSGGAETYTLVVKNNGASGSGSDATAVTVTDLLPTGVTNVKATSSDNTVTFNTSNPASVVATIPTLAAGAADTLTISVNAPSESKTTMLTNTANVAAAPDEFNTSATSSATFDVTVTATSTGTASLMISKIGTPATITAGSAETYTITVNNPLLTTAAGASVSDILPAGFTVVSATDTAVGSTITMAGNTVTDALASLAVGGSETLTIIATAGAAVIPTGQTSATVQNVASLTYNGQTITSAPASTTVIAPTQVLPPTGFFFLQSKPGDSTVATFVTNLYWNLLGRAPDPVGFQSWVAYGEANENFHGDQVIVAGFLNSPEYKTHYVTSLYEALLGRAPDAPGLAFWTDKLGNPGTPGGATGSSDEKYVVAAFLGSTEFYDDAGATPQGWINALYQDLLGRPAGGGDMTFWQREMTVRGPGDRDGIARDILSSPEAVHYLLDTFYPAPGGTAATPLPPPGSPAGTGRNDLSLLTGGGWENLYFSGPFDHQQAANDAFFAELVGGAQWDVVQFQMLTELQYFANSNSPVTTGAGGGTTLS